MMKPLTPLSQRQSGVALIVVLMLLIVTSIIALNAVRFGAVQMRIAANDQLRLNAYQAAQSVADATMTVGAYTNPTSALGAVACSSTSISGCSTVPTIISSLPNSFMASDLAAGNLSVKVTRIAPICGRPPPAAGISATWGAATFAVESTYNPTSQLGTSGIREGVIVLIPPEAGCS